MNRLLISKEITTVDIYTLEHGKVPLLISLPHDGSFIPDEIAERMTSAARRSPDTDWRVGQLYEPLAHALGASLLRPRASRYVIDLNRPADGHALYPGRRETGLIPTIGFDGAALYREAADEPDAVEIQQRINAYWQPYHQALKQELARLCAAHGRVVLWEGHSIRSRVPMLFNGELPAFNLGTADGTSCAVALQCRLLKSMESQKAWNFVFNGRFKGGFITRQYGRPSDGMDAIQLELAQRCYMDEKSLAYDQHKASAVQSLIEQLLRTCLEDTKDIS